MVRRLLIVACCVVVSGAPLADSLCYAGCADGKAAETHHACAPERDDATTINAVPHGCPVAGATTLRSVEVRLVLAALALPPSVKFDPPLPVISVAGDPRFNAPGHSHRIHTPLRL